MCTAKQRGSLTVAFVRCQSDASHTDVPTFYCRIAEDTTATHSICERDHAGGGDFILCFRHLLVDSERALCSCSSQNTEVCDHRCSLYMVFP